MELTIKPADNFSKIVQEFLRDHGLHRVIAFSGGADYTFPGIPEEDQLSKDLKDSAERLEKRVIEAAIQTFIGYKIAILTGGTAWGVPKNAAREAKKHGFTTVGVFPVTGKKYALKDGELDLSICVEPSYGESRWGDESSVFAKLYDASIVYSGSAGTLVEVAHALKMNEGIIKYNEGDPKIIVPIAGSGNVADGLPHIWAKDNVRRECMPSSPIYTGEDAAKFIINRLNLEKYYSYSGR